MVSSLSVCVGWRDPLIVIGCTPTWTLCKSIAKHDVKPALVQECSHDICRPGKTRGTKWEQAIGSQVHRQSSP